MMKIIIKEGKKNIFIPLPNWLLFSSLSAWIMRRASLSKEEEGQSVRLNISSRQMRKIRKCIRRMKKIHKDWCLVDLADGEDVVRIKM